MRGITSEHYGDFYRLNYFHSFVTENKFQSRIRAYENKDFCNTNMPSEDTKILDFRQIQKSDKAPFIIYAHLKCKIQKIDGCKNNSENSSRTKVSNQIPPGYSISTIISFKSIENKHDVYRGKDCMKKFCEVFREHAMKIMLFLKKKIRIKFLTKDQKKSYENAKICYICQEKLQNKYLKDKNTVKVEIIASGAVYGICNLKYNVPKAIPIVFHNGSNYGY